MFRRQASAQAALAGINAAVVGLLLAALYNPVWTAGITGSGDFALGIIAFLLLFIRRTPPWVVVAISALGGAFAGGGLIGSRGTRHTRFRCRFRFHGTTGDENGSLMNLSPRCPRGPTGGCC